MIDLKELDNDPWSTFPTKKDDLRALVAAVTWQPIETAPKENGRLILAYINLTPEQNQRTLAPTIIYWSKSGDFIEPCWTSPYFDRKLKAPLICWMEIPEPPKGEGP